MNLARQEDELCVYAKCGRVCVRMQHGQGAGALGAGIASRILGFFTTNTCL